jgi:hypothetical protein
MNKNENETLGAFRHQGRIAFLESTAKKKNFIIHMVAKSSRLYTILNVFFVLAHLKPHFRKK